MTKLLSRRALLCAAGGSVLGAFALAEPAERVVQIVAKKFEYVPDRIELRLGQPVVIELTAPEVTMGFSAYELGLRSDIVPGRVARLRFTPTRLGSFEFSCDVFCGSGHEEMGGVIVVTE